MNIAPSAATPIRSAVADDEADALGVARLGSRRIAEATVRLGLGFHAATLFSPVVDCRDNSLTPLACEKQRGAGHPGCRAAPIGNAVGFCRETLGRKRIAASSIDLRPPLPRPRCSSPTGVLKT